MIAVSRVFQWERWVVGALWMSHVPTWLKLLNVVLAESTWVRAVVVPGVVLSQVIPLSVAALVVAGTAMAPKVQEWTTWLRGRPRDPQQLVEYGAPSLDCMLVTIWSVPLLGWSAFVPIGFIMALRVARGAHWPLDTIAGVAVGLTLLLPMWWLR